VSRVPDPASLRRGRRHNDPQTTTIVAFLQRARLMDAVATVIAAEGHRPVNAVVLAEIAGISKRTIYDLGFANGEAVVVAAYGAAAEVGAPRIAAAFDAQDTWTRGFRAAVRRYFGLLAGDLRWARLWVIEGHRAPVPARQARDRATTTMVDRLAAAGAARVGAVAAIETVDGAARRHLQTHGVAGLAESADAVAAVALRAVCSAREAQAALAAPVRRRRADEALAAPFADGDEQAVRDAIDRALARADGRTLWQLLLDIDDDSPLVGRIVAGLKGANTLGVPVEDMMRELA
jgi:hypothetical protein